MKVETFTLERWMSTWEVVAKFDIAESGVYPLTTRELLDFLPPDERQSVENQLLDLRLGYNEARGTARLRGDIAATYENVNADQVLVTTGAIEANYLLVNSLLEAGDHVISVFPAYQQLFSVAKAVGCEVSLWRIVEDGGNYVFDLDALEKLVTPKTKMILINTPNNPTGALLSNDDLKRIYALAESVGAWVLCDEAYRWLDIPGGEPLAEPMRNLGPRAISVGTFSKPFGLPGLRLGWIAATEDIVKACWSARDFISLAPSGLSDLLASVALRERDQIVARNHAIVQQNLDYAEGWFSKHSELASWNPPRGGLLALMKYNVDLPSDTVANTLAADYSVMLAPGSTFGYEGHLRIGIGQTPAIFAEGLERTARCLERLTLGQTAAVGTQGAS
ncbi:MAG: aminotransferase class I/II-fold pyridoxal phosphate-dependent enzyme [Thermomicrobiales bacterium]|nr:aminotransferase class I/II-fold pyridoxal phosphate-dependent enzyme [Thermomicrobiales bacterium]